MGGVYIYTHTSILQVSAQPRIDSQSKVVSWVVSNVICGVMWQVSAQPRIDSESKVVGVVCIGEDVALRQRMLESSVRSP